MPVAEADRIRVGVLGLEGRHRWHNGLVLNRPRTEGYPRYRVERIPGLHGLAEGDENVESRSGQLGELARPSLLRGKTVTYEGEIQALTLPQLRRASLELRAAFADRRREHVMTVEPHPDNPLGRAMSFRARATAVDVDEEQTYRATHVPSPWCRPFIVTLRQGDPRYYETTEQSSGGSPLSIAYAGSAPGEPVFTVSGPADRRWRLAYDASPARYLEVDAPIPSGASVTVDFRQRRIVTSGGVDITGALVPGSTWWNEGVHGLEPLVTAAVTLTATARRPAPTGPGATASATGGELSHGDYFYVVTTRDTLGESTPGLEVAVTVPTPTKLVAVPAQPGATPRALVGGGTIPNGGNFIRITALRGGGETTLSETRVYDPVSPLTDTVLDITWPAVADATGYRVYIGDRARNTINGRGTFDVATNSFTWNGADGTPRQWPMANSAYISTASAAVNFDAVGGAAGYRVYRRRTPGGAARYFDVTAPPFTDTGAAGTEGAPPTTSTTEVLGTPTLAARWHVADF